MDTEQLIGHVQRLQATAERASDAVERAERGLEFAKNQMWLTAGFPQCDYWAGKRDAYIAVLEILTGEASE